MDACLRYARRHRSRTGTNPSVGTLLVKNGIVVGRGITALGGRPHAERVALDEAGARSVGATAYVTLEPCAHHGATPPCAQALIDGGVARVVAADIDPDGRVDGRGFAMLRDAGIDVEAGVGAAQAGDDLSGYLHRKQANRPAVTLKLALSADGKLGLPGREVAITGPLARAYGHRMRAEHDAIAVGGGTVLADDPDLTCRLPGLEDRSPHRFVFARSLDNATRLAVSASAVPVTLVSTEPAETGSAIRYLAAERQDGKLALPEVLEDIAGLGISTLMVEGGASLAGGFLDEELVDALALFVSEVAIGADGIASPVILDTVPALFEPVRTLDLGPDRLHLFVKRQGR